MVRLTRAAGCRLSDLAVGSLISKRDDLARICEVRELLCDGVVVVDRQWGLVITVAASALSTYISVVEGER